MTVPLKETQRDSETEAIRQTALDYIEGWYTGNAERMEHSLHPELAKRIVIPAENDATEDRLSQMSAMKLVQLTRSGVGVIPEHEQRKEVIILDCDGRSASAKIVATTWIDYLHLAKWEGRWVIVNVLWQLNLPHRGRPRIRVKFYHKAICYIFRGRDTDDSLEHVPLAAELRKRRGSLPQAFSRPMVRSLVGEVHLDPPLQHPLVEEAQSQR